jgi:hypothetical protein
MLNDFSEDGRKQLLSMLAEACPDGCHWAMTPGQEYNGQVCRLHRLWDEVCNGLGLSVHYPDPAYAALGEFKGEDFEHSYERLFPSQEGGAK